jgi:TolB protein
MSADTHPKNSNLVIFSAIDNQGNSDIYSLDYKSGVRKRLTFDKSIETTASFSPSGNNIIFTSDKRGRQEIYQMDINGENVRKISNGFGDYSKPVWSPDGSLIAFTKIIRGKFVIGIMTSEGYNERILTSGYVVEGVSWSPNSRYLVYSRKNSVFGKGSIPKLYVIDIVTGYERMLPTPANEGATDPDWIGLDNPKKTTENQ